MLKGKTVAVVIAAYNEEKQINNVIETIPEFVDWIIVVNDGSKDRTEEIVRAIIKKDKSSPYKLENRKSVVPNKYNRAEVYLEKIIESEDKRYPDAQIVTNENSRIVLINHIKNSGKGASLKSGFRWCRNNCIFCTATMDGDGQMDPSELESVCDPIVSHDIDYVKTNRLRHRSALLVIPKIRYFGNSILSLLTKIASGYWRISDTQTGYTAISLRALKAIRIHKIYDYYGSPNDILVKLNVAFCTVTEVDSKPVYNVGEKSKMKELKVVPKIGLLLFKSFWYRLYQKYLFRDFHPLFLLYHFAFILLIFCIYPLIKVIISLGGSIQVSAMSTPYFLLFILTFVIGFQSLLFAMWMDMLDNERLQK